MSGLLSTSVWLRGRGGQEVRQEGDHLYHVLCMTGGMRLNIYMCLRAMQIGRGVKGGSWLKWDVFGNKQCKYGSGCNAKGGPGRGVCLGNSPNELDES